MPFPQVRKRRPNGWDASPGRPPKRRAKRKGHALTPFVPGIVIIIVGIVLFWGSGRRSLSERARMFLEGQATICMPAGLAALGVGAWTKRGNGNGAEKR